VGALSIVRFRAAIKEPEELAYLFLAIGIGLGLGADQRVVTIVAFVVIAAAIVGRSRLRKAEGRENLLLTVGTHGQGSATVERIVDVLKKHCCAVNLRRFDELRARARITSHFMTVRSSSSIWAWPCGDGD